MRVRVRWSTSTRTTAPRPPSRTQPPSQPSSTRPRRRLAGAALQCRVCLLAGHRGAVRRWLLVGVGERAGRRGQCGVRSCRRRTTSSHSPSSSMALAARQVGPPHPYSRSHGPVVPDGGSSTPLPSRGALLCLGRALPVGHGVAAGPRESLYSLLLRHALGSSVPNHGCPWYQRCSSCARLVRHGGTRHPTRVPRATCSLNSDATHGGPTGVPRA